MSQVNRVLPPVAVRELSRRSDVRGTVRLGVHLALIVAAGWWVAVAGPWTLLPAMLALGIGQAALFAPIHETMHNTAFASRSANAVAGWLVACPSLLNRQFYTVFHLAHHRHTQDPLHDPELSGPKPDTVEAYWTRIWALPYWRSRLTVLADGWRGDMSAYPYIGPRAAPGVIMSLRLMSLFVVGCAVLSMIFVGLWAPLVFWIVPQMLGQPVLRLYLLTEHTECSEDANGLTNTRTTLTNALVHLLMWNMSYHAEHHLYPSIPFHRLAHAHRAIADRLEVIQPGYVRWHVGFLRGLRRAGENSAPLGELAE